MLGEQHQSPIPIFRYSQMKYQAFPLVQKGLMQIIIPMQIGNYIFLAFSFSHFFLIYNLFKFYLGKLCTLIDKKYQRQSLQRMRL